MNCKEVLNTLPSNDVFVKGTLPSNDVFVKGTLPSNDVFVKGTLPSNDVFVKGINELPNEILILICKHLNVLSLSKLQCTSKSLYKKIDDVNKWYIIDNMINADYYKLIPKTKETFNNYRFCIDWKELIIKKCTIMEEVIEWIEDYSDIAIISIYQPFSENLLEKVYNKISYSCLLSHQVLPINILYNIVESNQLSSTDWYYISSKQKIDLVFIEKYFDKIQWNPLSQNINIINYKIIEKYHDKLIWQELTKHGINEYILINFINYFDFICWSNISQFSVLSNDFIKTFLSFLDLDIIFRFQRISESLLISIVECFIADESYYFESIGLNQNLSKNFIIKYKDHLPLKILIRNRNISRKLLSTIFII
jgi:hypothetical protein